ncbi:phosphodiesterase [Marinobacterium lutimaris]|uniref:Icc protein n=1 Tax=Marinobacterium lutimaris TaxID=568106 RepID=A0A1H6D5N5_9GAMM|nr:phosphodiesterase [Marinobacterium lutimaris]SEG80630.1 Icc protein [Marinobacterium lutimaris]
MAEAHSDSIYLLQLTDCHLMPQPGQLFRDIDADRQLARVVEHLMGIDQPIDHLLLTGDLVHHGEAQAYRRLLDILAPLPGERHWIPGNHDEIDAMRAATSMPCGQEEVDLGYWRLLLLDSSSYPDGRGSGSLNEEELHWLQQRLAQSPERPVLIALHHNPLSTGSDWQDEIMLGNAAAFTELVAAAPQVKAVICGHLHQSQVRTIAGAQFWCSPSTSVQFRPAQSDFLLESEGPDSQPGYRWYRLDPDGSVESGLVRVDAVAPEPELG